jgi:superfamily I DNA and/or RNA helicase
LEPTQPHLVALAAALRAEEAAQRDRHAELARKPLAERVSLGFSWAPVKATGAWASGRAVRVRVEAARGATLHDGIASGDAVVVASIGSPDRGIQGICVGADERAAELLLDDEPPEGVLAVSLRFDAGTFARLHAALRRGSERETPPGRVLLGADPLPSEPVDDPAFDGLEAAQRDAASRALGTADLALVHGPPGTGKTVVAVALLTALVRRRQRVWALADSNAAVDLLSVRAAAAGLRVLRLGHPARIGSEAQALTVDAALARGPLAEAIAAIDRDLARARIDGRWQERRRLLGERDALVAEATSHAWHSADVIASTLGTLARVGPTLPPPDFAIVDEATQAIEPAIWAAVPLVPRLALIGDPEQLGPVVVDPGNPLALSAMLRLVGRLELPMLEVQRRMNTEIASLVRAVYGPRYRPHPSVAEAVIPGVRPVCWVDTAGTGTEEEVDPATRSTFNRLELALVRIAVLRLREAGVQEIAVIAPYSAQVARLRADPALAGVEIDTVNAFQGREADALVCSFVRSNLDGELGFVADGRRLTVALTRARRSLTCIGDSATLGGHPRFAALLEAIDAAGGHESAFAAPWSEAL